MDRPRNITKIAENPDFVDIEKVRHLLTTFEYCMLRIGQILTKRESERYGITLKQLARYMARNCKKMHDNHLTAKEIRSKLYGQGAELRGGGVKAEWQTVSDRDGRKQPQYSFTFSRILRPEDYLMPNTKLRTNENSIRSEPTNQTMV